MSECEIFLYVRYVSGFNLTRIIAIELNAQIRKHIKKTTEKSIAKYTYM